MKQFLTELASGDNNIICVSESWLNNSISDSEVIDSTFRLFRRDRDSIENQKQRGGGVFIAVKKVLQADLLKVTHLDVEQVFVKIKLDQHDLVVGVVYIPPASELEVYEKHMQDVVSISNKYTGCKMIILGDYNLPDMKWHSSRGDDEFFGESVQSDVVMREFSLLGLSQINKIHNANGKYLDLSFTNCDLTFRKLPALVPEDNFHPTIGTEILLD